MGVVGVPAGSVRFTTRGAGSVIGLSGYRRSHVWPGQERA